MKLNLALLLAALLVSSAAQAQSVVATPEQAAAAGIPTPLASTPGTVDMHYQQMIGKLQQNIMQLQSDLRELQRQNIALAKKVDDSNAKSGGVSDRVQELQNVQLGNVFAGQKQIAQQQKDILAKLWGEQKRDCPDLDAKHQQVKVIQRPDRMRSAKFVCFDGKAVHLGTEVHDPAE